MAVDNEEVKGTESFGGREESIGEGKGRDEESGREGVRVWGNTTERRGSGGGQTR